LVRSSFVLFSRFGCTICLFTAPCPSGSCTPATFFCVPYCCLSSAILCAPSVTRSWNDQAAMRHAVDQWLLRFCAAGPHLYHAHHLVLPGLVQSLLKKNFPFTHTYTFILNTWYTLILLFVRTVDSTFVACWNIMPSTAGIAVWLSPFRSFGAPVILWLLPTPLPSPFFTCATTLCRQCLYILLCPRAHHYSPLRLCTWF